MKTCYAASLFLVLTILGSPAQNVNTDPTQAGTTTVPQATTPKITNLGADFNVWQWQTYELLGNGQVGTHAHSITELASGLNYQDPSSGQWIPAQELIEPYSQGAIAQRGQHQVIFANNINSSGAIDELTRDSKRLVSNITGLMYYDPATGQSAEIAQIQNSEGQLIAKNQVLYPNAFEGVNADVLYTYRLDGMEQDVVLREQLPAPESFGLNSATVELVAVTEFLNPPEATVWNESAEQGEEPDQAIVWGATSLGHGKAFSLDGQDAPTRVIKQYVDQDGHYYLLEKVRFQDIQAALSSLPGQASNARGTRGLAAKTIQFPKAPAGRQAARPIRMALQSASRQGYVLDYVSLNTAYTNFIFQGDTTYYVSGNVNLSGTNSFEGNTVIKYAANASLTGVSGSTFRFLSAPYRPAIFTAKDDNTVGEVLSGSTGTPSGYYANPALVLATGSSTLSEFRILYANRGISSIAGATPTIVDAQFINSGTGISDIGSTIVLQNSLFSNVKTNFNTAIVTRVVYLQNVTFNNAFDISDGSANPFFFATNCVFVNQTNLSGLYFASYNGFYGSPSKGTFPVSSSVNPFQVAGNGSCYLTNGSTFHNAGTASIGAAVLTNIVRKTTYPPIIYTSASFSSATNFGPQAQRGNTNSPDLGYHYDPLDYVFANTTAASNLNFSAGTAVGWYYASSGATYALAIGDSATASFNGTATSPCHFVKYSTVQEGNGSWASSSYVGGITGQSYTHTVPSVTAQFTTFSTPAGEAGFFRDNAANNLFVLDANNCEMYAGGGGYHCSINVSNCLWVNAGVGLWENYGAANMSLRNCTFIRGNINAHSGGSNPWPLDIYNCAFDSTTFTMSPDGGPTNGYYTDYNSFVSLTNITPYLGGHELTNVVSYNWQSSWFGNYYLPANSPLTNAGSISANLVGLYHFTTQTNQMPETNSVVDIGYHYVATDANGNPLDTVGNGVPDYIEDSNGNGVFDNGDLGDWLVSPYNGLSRTFGFQVFTPLK